MIAAQAMRVVRKPYLSKSPRNRNGQVDPTIFLVDRQMPYATARLQMRFLLLNHSPSDNVMGL